MLEEGRNANEGREGLEVKREKEGREMGRKEGEERE